MQSSKGKHTERVCNRYTKDRQVPTERKPEHIEIISYVRFRRAHADSHAAVVAQLSIRLPPKLSLAAAFACVEISPSVVVAIQPHKKTLYLGEQRVKAGEQPCRMFILDLPGHGHGGFWQRKGLVPMDGTAPKARHIDVNSLLGSLPLPWTTKWRSVLHPGGNCPFFGSDHCWTRKTVLKITPLCVPCSLGLPPQKMWPLLLGGTDGGLWRCGHSYSIWLRLLPRLGSGGAWDYTDFQTLGTEKFTHGNRGVLHTNTAHALTQLKVSAWYCAGEVPPCWEATSSWMTTAFLIWAALHPDVLASLLLSGRGRSHRHSPSPRTSSPLALTVQLYNTNKLLPYVLEVF